MENTEIDPKKCKINLDLTEEHKKRRQKSGRFKPSEGTSKTDKTMSDSMFKEPSGPKLGRRPPITRGAIVPAEQGPMDSGTLEVLLEDLGWNREVPKSVRETLQVCPDGIYEALANRMETIDGEGDRLWEMRERLLLATVYGARRLGKYMGRLPVNILIAECIRKRIQAEKPGWDLATSNFTLEGLMAYNPLERTTPPPVWVLVVLPEGMNNTMFLGPEQHIGGRYDKEAILFEPFPWELPQTQHYKIANVQSMLMEEEVRKGVEERLRGRIMCYYCFKKTIIFYYR